MSTVQVQPITIPAARALLFDLDGTLIDSEDLHYRSTLMVLAERGLGLTRQAFDRYRGWGERDTWLDLAEILALTDDPEALATARTQAFGSLLARGGALLMPGMERLLVWAGERGYPMAVVSSLPRLQIEAALRAAGLIRYFPLWWSGHDDVARSKPAPDVYQAAALGLGVAPGDCLAFEDSPVGLTSARDAGCFVIGVHLDERTRAMELAHVVCADGHEALGALQS
jgi:HAD superfamily hydrolase (TIGR01509 family)